MELAEGWGHRLSRWGTRLLSHVVEGQGLLA